MKTLAPNGTLISTLTGSTANDQIGNAGVTVLSNGNYVVRSLNCLLARLIAIHP